MMTKTQDASHKAQVTGEKQKAAFKEEKYGLVIEFPSPFLQEHLESFETVMLELEPSNKPVTNSKYRRDSITAALRCGWVSGAAEHELVKKEPHVIMWASTAIQLFIAETRQVRRE